MDIFNQFFEFAVNRWHLVLSFVVLLIALFVVEGRRAGRKVGPQETVQLLNHDEAQVVDIRERKDFNEGHIKGAIHIPMAQLSEKTSQLQKYQDKLIILADKAGQHSGMAGKQLQKDGFNVARLAGGMLDWRGASLPVSKGDKSDKKEKKEKQKKGK